MPRSLLRLLCLGLLVGVAAPARGQSAPVTGFSFLRLEPSARSAALAGAVGTSPSGDVAAFYANPAALDASMHGGLALSYLNHLSDLRAAFVTYGRHVEGIGTLAAGVRYLGWGELEATDAAGQSTGTFSASDVALTLGAARSYGEALSYGASVHFIHSSIDAYDATAVAADLGLRYTLADGRTAFSASLHHAGRVLNSLGATDDELPLDLRVGVARRLQYVPLLLSVTAYNLHDPDTAPEGAKPVARVLDHLVAGGELQFSDAFQVRFGYNHRRHEALRTHSRLDLAGFSTGFGLRVSRLRVDYAFASWSAAGGLHQLSVRTRL